MWHSGPLSEGGEAPGRIGLRLSVDLWSVFPYLAMPQEQGCLRGPGFPKTAYNRTVLGMNRSECRENGEGAGGFLQVYVSYVCVLYGSHCVPITG